MKYITIVAKDFESAVKKARQEYGHTIRIHSRRDISRRGGFLWLNTIPSVELVCYIADDKNFSVKPAIEEKEAIIEEKKPTIEEKREKEKAVIKEEKSKSVEVTPSLNDTLLSHANDVLQENQFSPSCIAIITSLLKEELKGIKEYPTKEEFELMIVDKIVSIIAIDHETQLNPPHYFILLGPTGTGKTTSIAKIGALYSLQSEQEFRHSVHFVTLDDYRVGAVEQLRAFGKSLQIDVDLIRGEQDMYRVIQQNKTTDVVLIDTIGRSPKDKELTLKMNTMLALIPPEEKKMYVALSGSMKTEDILTSIEM
ncbi:MAG: hypothetical protein EOM67_06455, partial [Spirochaetia bacterium]|nr:hypothetical protein [Spirochaetia bacterium]